jgi:hypothetical protein
MKLYRVKTRSVSNAPHNFFCIGLLPIQIRLSGRSLSTYVRTCIEEVYEEVMILILHGLK